MTKFRELRVGQTFDFVGPDSRFNSFYARCEKVSARGYRPLEGPCNGKNMLVGNTNAAVYHVDSAAQ